MTDEHKNTTVAVTEDPNMDINGYNNNSSDYNLLEPDEDKKICCCFRGKHKRAKCVVGVSLITLFLFMGISVILYYAAAPALVSSLLKTSKLELHNIVLTSSDHTTMTGQMTSSGMLIGLPALPGLVSSAEVTMGRAQLLMIEKEGGEGVVIGHLSGGDPIPAPVTGGDAPVVLSSLLTVSPAEETAFARFGNLLIYNKSVTVRMRSTDAVVKIKVGSLDLSIKGVTLDKTTVTKGCEGLKTMVVDDFQITLKNVPGKGDRMNSIVSGRVWNPANVSANSGFVRTGLIYQGQDLGTIAGNMTLAPGWNRITAEGILLEDGGTPSQLVALGNMNTQYMQGERINITTVARPNCSDLPIFSALLETLSLKTYLVGMRVGTIMESHIDLTTWDIVKMMPHCLVSPHDCKLPTAILFKNPFLAPVTLHSFKLQVTYEQKVVGNSVGVMDMKVPGNASVYAPDEPVIPPSIYNKDVFSSLLTALEDGMVMLGAHGVVRIDVANLKIVSNYTQMENLPTCLTANMHMCDNYKRCEVCYGDRFFSLEKDCAGMNEENMVATCLQMVTGKTIKGSSECMAKLLTPCYNT